MGVPILRAGRVLGVLVDPEPHAPAIQRGRDRDARDRRHGAGRTGGRAASWSARRNCGPATASRCCRCGSMASRFCPGLARGHRRAAPGDPAAAAAGGGGPGARGGAPDRARSTEMHTSIDTLLSAGDIAGQGEHFEVLETYRLFAAGPGLAQPHDGGGADRASPRKRRCRRCRTTPAPACATSPTPICASGWPISTISPTACCGICWAPTCRALRRLPDEAIVVARSMGPAELLDYDRNAAEGPGAGGRLAERPCRDRRARARHSRARPLRRI